MLSPVSCMYFAFLIHIAQHLYMLITVRLLFHPDIGGQDTKELPLSV